MKHFVHVKNRVRLIKLKSMLKIALFVFMVLDCIYQAWGNPSTVWWSVYYEVLHYGFAFVIALYAALNIPKLKSLSFVFMAYFGIISIKEFSLINLSFADYWLHKSNPQPLQFFSFLAIGLLLIFVIIKLIKRAKKNE